MSISLPMATATCGSTTARRDAGRWRPTENGYATEWDSGHTGEWSIVASGDGLDYVSRDGKQQLKMLGVMFGDPEGLAG